MASFEENYKKVLASEGNYHNGYIGNQKDDGGETYRGIARVFHPYWDGWAVIDQLNKTRQIPNKTEIPQVNQSAYNYSKKTFWDNYGLGGLNSQWVANMAFEILWGFPGNAIQLKTSLGIISTTKWSDFVRMVNNLNPNNVYQKFRALYAKFLTGSKNYKKFKIGYDNRIASWPGEIPSFPKNLFPVDPLAGAGEQKTDLNIINLFIFLTTLFFV